MFFTSRAFHNRHDTLGLFVYRRAVEKKVIVPAANVVVRGQTIVNRTELAFVGTKAKERDYKHAKS